MLRAGGVAESCAPDVLGEEEAEEGEEEAGDLQPEDAAYTAEGAEKPSDASACRASVFVAFGGEFSGFVENFFPTGYRGRHGGGD